MLTIDGSFGEGGGQILRTALSLSVRLREPFRITDIRPRRSPPGLRPQHLAAVLAAAEISDARVVGASVGSRELTFIPQRAAFGAYRFSIGTAGSTTLVLQTLLPALMTASDASSVRIEGGTHNPRAPTYEFLARAFLPLIERMGPKIRPTLLRPGFYPRGGGEVHVDIVPAERLAPFRLHERGGLRRLSVGVQLSKLPRHIGQREIAVLKEALPLAPDAIDLRVIEDSFGPGNVVSVECELENVTEVFTAVGERGVPAEKVASEAAQAMSRYWRSGAAVGEHLADQLLVPLALAGSGSFVTSEPTRHTLTNIEVIRQFVDVDIRCSRLGDSERWLVGLGDPDREDGFAEANHT